MTPGNHTNGPGGRYPDVQAWLDYNESRGTLTTTGGGWLDKQRGIPLTDQFVDIGGIRFILINSGAVLTLADTPGWPVPAKGGRAHCPDRRRPGRPSPTTSSGSARTRRAPWA